MDLHPIPRQITTFEFKLIGFMTVKQFGYVLLAGVVGYLFFLAIPIKFVNIFVGVLIFSVGPLFAFVPINDRPLDVFVRNLFRRLNSPTQYVFHKQNPPMGIFEELYFDVEPHIVLAHVDSREKLAAYMASKSGLGQGEVTDPHHAHIHALFQTKPQIPAKPAPANTPGVSAQPTNPKEVPPQVKKSESTKHPVLGGIVYNKRHIPLPGILLYVRDPRSGNVLRILKTNPHGVFATFHPLPEGEYLIEIVDSAGNYLFEKQPITVSGQPHTNLEFVSKESI